MFDQVSRFSRSAMFNQVFRAGDDKPRGGANFPGDQCRVFQWADTDGEVDAFFYQVDIIIIEQQVDLDIRVCVKKLVQVGQDATTAECRTGGNLSLIHI